MRHIPLVVGVLIALAGLIVIALPSGVLSVAAHPVSPLQLYVSAAIRVALGVLFLAVAGASRAPRLLQVVGIIALIAGVATVWLGVGRAQQIADWTSHQGLGVVRLLGIAPLALGVAIVYACLPVQRAA